VLLALVVAAPLGAAALTPVLGRWLGRNVAAFNGLVLLALVVGLLRELPGVLDGEVATFSQAWLPSGPSLDLRLDALALVFALVVTLIGVLVMAYALALLRSDDPAAVRIPHCSRSSPARCSASCSPTTSSCCSSHGS
jgi:NADH:ubiquinone oxidoreductase subunit 5 (subunit L)/multisubunit Na+/H+ antiporter MnhA subunit